MGIVKLIFGAAVLGAVAFGGDYCSINDKLFNPVRYEDKNAEPGYYRKPFELEKKITLNNKGNLETYIIAPDLKLPVLQGNSGPQLGNSDYVWSNLPKEQRDRFVAEGWSALDDGKKVELVRPLMGELVGKMYSSFLSQLGLR